MNLHLLHNVSGIAIVVSLILKISIHYYLDQLHERNLGIESIFILPLQYIKPYKSTINDKFTTLKFLCNFFLVIFFASLFLNIIWGVLML